MTAGQMADHSNHEIELERERDYWRGVAEALAARLAHIEDQTLHQQPTYVPELGDLPPAAA